MGLENPQWVREAIEAAQAHAKEQNIPLTAERLACCLNVDEAQFSRMTAPGYKLEDPRFEESLALIRDANRQATADVLEDAFTKGRGASIHELYLKHHGGYQASREPSPSSVVITGENRIEP